MTETPASDFVPGLEGVIAFETEIAEPDKDGGSLRYRGVDIEDLVGKVTFGDVWSLLVDGEFGAGLPPAEPFPLPVHSGDVRVDVQAALAMLTPIWGYRPLLDIDEEEARSNLARSAVMALSYVAQSARGIGLPAVSQARIDECSTIVERFMVRWQGDPDPKHVEAVDAYWTSAAEHGLNASTFTARVIAPKTHARASFVVPRRNWAHPNTKPPSRWRPPPSPNCAGGARTGRSRPTSNSGPPSYSTSHRFRRTCLPRCSPVHAPPVGARTFSNRKKPDDLSDHPRGTSAPTRESPRRSRAGNRSPTHRNS